MRTLLVIFLSLTLFASVFAPHANGATKNAEDTKAIAQAKEWFDKATKYSAERKDDLAISAYSKALAEKNKKEGDVFLAENGKKDGVKTTASGLQYKVVTEGTGKAPHATDKVTVNYRGTLLDGTEFDSSYKRGEPATFGLNQVIKGWTEGIPLMKEGSKWTFFIPSELAYGDRGTPGGPIGPNAVLIFDVELLSIGEKAPAVVQPGRGVKGK